MSTHGDDSFGTQYSEETVYDIVLTICEDLQAFYMSGSTSKYPEGKSLEDFVKDKLKQYL